MSDNNRLLLNSLEIEPKTYDIDFVGHVNNIVYVRWLEDLRIKWLESYYPIAEEDEEGITPILLRTEIDYINQIKLQNIPVIGHVWVETMERVRFTLGFEFTYNGKVMAQAKQFGIWYNMQRQKPIRIPERVLAHVRNEEKAHDDIKVVS